MATVTGRFGAQVRSASRSPPGTQGCLVALFVQPLLSRAFSAVPLHGVEVQFGRPGEALKKVRVQLYLTLGYLLAPCGEVRQRRRREARAGVLRIGRYGNALRGGSG